jgi:hypothetical protein
MLIKRKVPIFNCTIYCFVGMDDKKRFIEAAEATYRVKINRNGNHGGLSVGSIIWIKEPDLEQLTHELHHCCGEIAKARGIQDKGGEFEAYLQGWALPWFWERIIKLSERKKK